MVVRLHKKRTVFVIVFLFLLFQQALQTYTSGIVNTMISYSDEVLECLLLLLLVIRFIQGKVSLTRIEWRMVIYYVIFLFFGLASSLINQLQSVFVTLTDVLVCSKFLVFYFSIRILLPKSTDYRALMVDLARWCRIIAVVLFLVALHDMLFEPWFPKREFRYFMYALRLCFPHPSHMAVACISCVSALIGAMGCDETEKRRKGNMVCIGLLLMLTIFTMRSKAIAAALCVALFYILLVKMKIFSRVLIYSGGGLLAVIIGLDQLFFYYTGNVSDYVRARLLTDSVYLAGKNFPFGTGFATFGSALAAERYSPVYTQLGYGSLYGGSKQDPRYLCDAFWPTVIAQSGWLGSMAFLAVVIGLLQIPFQTKQRDPYMLWGMLSILVYELISSIAEPAFFNPPVAVLMIIFALMVNISEENVQMRKN